MSGNKTGLNAFDIIELKENKAIGMVLPCGKVITFEKRGGRNITHAEAQPPRNGEFTLVSDEDLTSEASIAFNFARRAFEIYFPVHR